jgi:CDP-diacylglycerol--serine O-phosphatidyltransferase
VLVYSLCAILRLARYNVQALQNSGDKRDSFQGLPSPVPAVFLASLVWFCQDFAIPLSDPIIRSVVHILVVCLAFLMVSTIRYPDFAGLKVEKKYIYQHHVTLVLIMCVIVLIGKFFFLAASSLYILSGLVLSLNEMRKTKKVEESEPQSPPDQEQSRAER